MQEREPSDNIKASFDQIKSFTNANTVIGNPIITPNGVTVIPVSKVTVGFASAGVDIGDGRSHSGKNSGGGGGTGVAITPVAFLSVGADAEVKLIPINGNGSIDKVSALIEHTPELIQKIRESLS